MVGAAGEVHLQRCIDDLQQRWVCIISLLHVVSLLICELALISNYDDLLSNPTKMPNWKPLCLGKKDFKFNFLPNTCYLELKTSRKIS